MNINNEIKAWILSNADEKFVAFSAGLMPGTENVAGIKTPVLKAYAKELAKRDDIGDFLSALPHKYFEENQLHAFVVALEKDFDKCIEQTEKFLPYIDNWGTCDQFSPAVFKKHKAKLLPYAEKWTASDAVYTIRYGIGTLMRHFLDDNFETRFADMAAAVQNDEYYVMMMKAWYFATALAKHWEAVIPYIAQNRLDKTTHNKAIQKAVESYRITDEKKAYLRTLRIK
ncbi:MAG: DNA alkylation repair protein [Firmicutes bacterium]|nr:DNA alkylation repair protein [Bacillota bacterium]